MKEIWKDVKGFEGHYQVSNKGRVKRLPIKYHGIDSVGRACVKSKPNEYFPTVFLRGKGYPTVDLCIPGEGRAVGRLVHRLVAQAFLPDFSSKLVVDHVDMDKTNNNLENLEMVTNYENLRRSHEYGSHSKRHGQPCERTRAINDEQCELILEMYFSKLNQTKNPWAKPFSQRWLARCFKTTQPVIKDLTKGRRTKIDGKPYRWFQENRNPT